MTRAVLTFWLPVALACAVLVGGTIGNYRAEMDRCAANREACLARAGR